MTLREKIRDCDDMETEVIEVPQWGATIEVRSMSSRMRAKMLQRTMGENGKFDFETMYPELLIACCYDPDTGELAFQAEDREWLHDKNAGAVEKLAQSAMRLSGLTKEAVEEGKDES